jgi:predicted esterase
MSGGAKNSAFVAGEVAKAHHQLIGLLMMGCNRDMATKEYRKRSPPDFLGVPIFLSSGKDDTIATPAQSEEVRNSMKRTGFANVRLESHDGGHVVSQPHVTEALKWFVATGNSSLKTPTPSAFDTFFKKR